MQIKSVLTPERSKSSLTEVREKQPIANYRRPMSKW